MLKIACPCGHVGIVSAESLPRELTCARCGPLSHGEAEDGARIANRAAVDEWLLGEHRAPREVKQK